MTPNAQTLSLFETFATAIIQKYVAGLCWNEDNVWQVFLTSWTSIKSLITFPSPDLIST